MHVAAALTHSTPPIAASGTARAAAEGDDSARYAPQPRLNTSQQSPQLLNLPPNVFLAAPHAVMHASGAGGAQSATAEQAPAPSVQAASATAMDTFPMVPAHQPADSINPDIPQPPPLQQQQQLLRGETAGAPLKSCFHPFV